MRGLCVGAMLVVAGISATAQIHITKTEVVALPEGHLWMAPGWAPNGQAFFVSSANYVGLWRYDLQTGTLMQLTEDVGAGFGWTVSGDGAHLAYRRTLATPDQVNRTQEIVRLDLVSGLPMTVASASSVELPVYAGGVLVVNDALKGVAVVSRETPELAATAVLGIENQKIVLMKGGEKVLLDPFGDGSYIWPSLSPDGQRLLAYDMRRGAFICDLGGTVVTRLGRLDAPVWSRSGSWIISMKEVNDGNVITGSDLYATTSDGRKQVRLTSTPTIELMPACSPVDSRILCSTSGGSILMLTYEEAGQ
jgi:Tol biopolymer transport system component